MKLPRDVSGPDAVKAFIRLGFIVDRQRGSHIILRRGSNVAVVPNHRPIRIGTLAAVLREAGVPLASFIDQL